MGGVLPALRFLGLVSSGQGGRPPAPRSGQRRRHGSRQRPGKGAHQRVSQRARPQRVRVRASSQRDPGGARRTVVDAEVLLGPADHAAPTGPRARRPGRAAPRRRPRPLVALGLASAPVHLTGHPRIRERALAGLRQRRRREKVVTASIGALLGLVLLSWGAVRSPLLAVEEVAVHGVPTEVSQEVLATAGVRPGQNVLDVDLDEVEARLAALPWVQDATVRRQLPSTVEIRVSTRTAVLLGEFGGASYLIDADGLVIGLATAETDTQDLAPITLPTAPVVGRQTDAAPVLAAASVAAAMPPGMEEWIVGYEATSAEAIDVALRVPTDTGPVELVAHLGRPVDVDVKAVTIASLVQETVIEQGMRPRALDVRIPDRPSLLA